MFGFKHDRGSAVSVMSGGAVGENIYHTSMNASTYHTLSDKHNEFSRGRAAGFNFTIICGGQ